MFSGIIEAQSRIIRSEKSNESLRIWIQKPMGFDDLNVGDSISTNGVCLTVEKWDENEIQFCLGAETLKILNTGIDFWFKNNLNLERSLVFGQRVHGHLVTGHVDSLARVQKSEQFGDCWMIQVQIPSEFHSYFWKKGSICLNGVSLTVNSFEKGIVEVCLIPETILATNLKYFNEGDLMSFEVDYLAKAYFHSKNQSLSQGGLS